MRAWAYAHCWRIDRFEVGVWSALRLSNTRDHRGASQHDMYNDTAWSVQTYVKHDMPQWYICNNMTLDKPCCCRFTTAAMRCPAHFHLCYRDIDSDEALAMTSLCDIRPPRSDNLPACVACRSTSPTIVHAIRLPLLHGIARPETPSEPRKCKHATWPTRPCHKRDCLCQQSTLPALRTQLSPDNLEMSLLTVISQRC